MAEISLQVAALIASFFQSVVGIGFGMVAGPVVLMVLNDPAAVMISTLLSWLIALVLLPSLRQGTDWQMLQRLAIGAAFGLPFGLALLAFASISGLKLIAGLVIGGLTAAMTFGLPGVRTPGTRIDYLFGILGGIFGGCLAIPGPPAVMRMNGLGYPKATTRATMVTFFCLIWPIIFTGQWTVIGLTLATLWNTLTLIPATLTGVFIGNWAASRVSERFFRNLVLVFLCGTSVSLLVDAVL